MFFILALIFLLIDFQSFGAHKLKQNDFSNWQVGTKSAQNGPQAENIKCKNEMDDNEEHFSALITLPPGFGTIPVFHDASHINPAVSEECLMKQVSMGGVKFSMIVSDFKTCGVQIQKANDGAQWMAVTIRFPFVGGLRMAEDEYITIMCKPQDRTIIKNHVIDLKSTAFNPPKTIFSSAPLDFDCKLDLYIKDENDNTFSKQLPSDGVIEMGSEVQLRGTVRSGDGWRFAMIRDVTVHKVSASTSSLLTTTNKKSSATVLSQLSTDLNPSYHHNKNNVISDSQNKKQSTHRYGRSVNQSTHDRSVNNQSTHDRSVNNQSTHDRSVNNRQVRSVTEAAFLVFNDGCRNPAFRNVAPQHPYQDSSNNLIVNFNFKAFMFQDMEDGDTIRITAKLVACVDQHECQPTRCLDDDQYGYGRKKWSLQENHSLHALHSNISDFSSQLQFKVVAPGFSSMTIKAESQDLIDDNEFNIKKYYIDRKCRNVVYLIGSLSVLFSSALTIAATIIVCKSKSSKK